MTCFLIKMWVALAKLACFTMISRGTERDGFVFDLSSRDRVKLLWRKHGSEELILESRDLIADQPVLVRLLCSKRGHKRIWVRLDKAKILQRMVELTNLTATKLRSKVEEQIPDLTPWEIDEILWDYVVVDRNQSFGKVLIRLTVVVKSSLRGVLALIDMANRHVVCFEAAGQEEFGLSDVALSHSASTRSRVPSPLIAAASVCALSVIIWVPELVNASLVVKSSGLGSADLEAGGQILGSRLPVAQKYSDLRHLGVIAKQTDAPTILLRLLARLPDDTKVKHIEIMNGQICIAGSAISTSRIFQDIMADKRIQDPHFFGKVIWQPNGTSTFDIRATIGNQ